jgi:hypothetical protein
MAQGRDANVGWFQSGGERECASRAGFYSEQQAREGEEEGEGEGRKEGRRESLGVSEGRLRGRGEGVGRGRPGTEGSSRAAGPR